MGKRRTIHYWRKKELEELGVGMGITEKGGLEIRMEPRVMLGQKHPLFKELSSRGALPRKGPRGGVGTGNRKQIFVSRSGSGRRGKEDRQGMLTRTKRHRRSPRGVFLREGNFIKTLFKKKRVASVRAFLAPKERTRKGEKSGV